VPFPSSVFGGILSSRVVVEKTFVGKWMRHVAKARNGVVARPAAALDFCSGGEMRVKASGLVGAVDRRREEIS
jgi:hypothetical protein